MFQCGKIFHPPIRVLCNFEMDPKLLKQILDLFLFHETNVNMTLKRPLDLEFAGTATCTLMNNVEILLVAYIVSKYHKSEEKNAHIYR